MQSKTLYVADLDGTLLDRKGMLSRYTIQTIRRMIDTSVPFTIATARSLQAANDLIWHLGLKLPSILANGAIIFDSTTDHLHDVSPCSLSTVSAAMEVLWDHGHCGFLYCIVGGKVSVFYRSLQSEADRAFHAYRASRFHGRVYQVDNLLEIAAQHTSFFLATTGSYEALSKIQQDLQRLHTVTAELYLNEYTGYYYLDIFSSANSKAEGLLSLQRLTGADELVAFGDNFTDIPMLLVADRAYVPKNGVAAARNIADQVLDYAYTDSVAHFLSREMGWE